MRRVQKSPTPRKRSLSGISQQIAHRTTHGATGVQKQFGCYLQSKNRYRPRLAFTQKPRAVFIGGDVIREIR